MKSTTLTSMDKYKRTGEAAIGQRPNNASYKTWRDESARESPTFFSMI